MTIKVFHKTLEAVLFTGDNVAEVHELTGKSAFHLIDPEDLPLPDNDQAVAEVWDEEHGVWHEVCPGEWIVEYTTAPDVLISRGAVPLDALADDGWVEVHDAW